MEDRGTLKGIEKVETTVICPKETESGLSLFDFSGNEVFIFDFKFYTLGVSIKKKNFFLR